MKNNDVQVKVEKVDGEDILVIRVKMQEPTRSTSGKTLVVASTHGNVVSDAVVQGKPVVVGVNAYIKP